MAAVEERAAVGPATQPELDSRETVDGGLLERRHLRLRGAKHGGP